MSREDVIFKLKELNNLVAERIGNDPSKQYAVVDPFYRILNLDAEIFPKLKLNDPEDKWNSERLILINKYLEFEKSNSQIAMNSVLAMQKRAAPMMPVAQGDDELSDYDDDAHSTGATSVDSDTVTTPVETARQAEADYSSISSTLRRTKTYDSFRVLAAEEKTTRETQAEPKKEKGRKTVAFTEETKQEQQKQPKRNERKRSSHDVFGCLFSRERKSNQGKGDDSSPAPGATDNIKKC